MSYVLFISEEKLKDSTAINLNVDVNLLLPYVLQSQRIYVKTKIGSDLYSKLVAEMLPSWAFYHAIPFLRFKAENGNIYSKNSETGTPITTEEAQHLREEVRNYAEYMTERMIDYICNNTSSFPEYSTNSGADVSPDKNAYYSGLNLERPTQGPELTLRDFLTSDLT